MRAIVAGALLPLGVGASPQELPSALVAPGLVRLSEGGRAGALTLAHEPGLHSILAQRHAEGAPFGLTGLPWPGGLEADVELFPVEAFEPGARARVVRADGSVAWLAPSVRCFAGRVVVAGRSGTAFLASTETGLDGYFELGGELTFLASAGSPGRATLVHASGLGRLDAGVCNVVDRPPREPDEPEPLALVTPTLRTAHLFIEADEVFRARFASDQACIDYAALLVAASSAIYRRDIGTRLRIPDGYLRVWNTTPPWGVITGVGSLRNVYTWWQSAENPLRALPRAAVHVFTSPAFGGTSRGLDGLCSTAQGYEISGLTGRFPFPIEHTDRYNWDLFVVSHELGHTFGSPHSSLYEPPIECVDGSGPDSGTLMSYCHITYGIAGIGMRFHLREQQRIRRSSADATCLESQALAPGDYDGDGALDPGDLVALRWVLDQGFRSLAAEEVLDLDGSGTLSDADHDLLAELVYDAPPARTVFRNGAGVNPGCLEALGNPVLGTTWRARIHAPGVGSATLLVAYDRPFEGLFTARGELLVRTAPLGGTKLYGGTSISDGTSALHEVPLPLDTALFGLELSLQGLVVDGPAGDRYCNALDVVLSPWE